jgi:DNA-binding beta-propeller fold protein YncE
MTHFLVPDKETDRRIAKGKAAEQAPLADHKKAGRRLSLLCPWITQTKPGRQEPATGVVFMRRCWSYVCSTLAITLTLLGAPLHAEFAYVTNNGDNTISGYTINPATGTLSPIASSPFPTGNHPGSMSVDPSGKFVYVTNDSGLGGYAINPVTGALTAIAGSPFVVGPAFSTAVDPSGRFIYVIGDSSVLGHAIDPVTGALTATAGSPVATGLSPGSVNSTTGALTAIVGSPFATGLSPDSVTVDSSGKFVYTANIGASTVSGYTINPTTGALTVIAGPPTATGSSPGYVVVSRAKPSVRAVYITNEGSKSVSVIPRPILSFPPSRWALIQLTRPSLPMGLPRTSPTLARIRFPSLTPPPTT